MIVLFILTDIDGDREVHINGNITELIGINDTEVIGINDTELKCSFSIESGDLIAAVIFLAHNSTQFEPIAQFPVYNNTSATLTSFGIYIFGNLTLTNITNSSSEAVILFNNLSCIHEREYKCRILVFSNGDYPYETKEFNSNVSSISVKGR